MEAWILGVMTNIASSAAWDFVKGVVGAQRNEPISLGLEQPALEARSDASTGPGRRSTDLVTLERIQELLPGTGITMEYLRDHDFGNTHRGAFLEPLDRFLEQTAGPESKFLSPGLERLRQEFRCAVNSFQALIGKYTFRHIQEDMYEIPSEWERNGSGLYWKAVRELNSAAKAVVDKYDEVVSTARRELLQ